MTAVLLAMVLGAGLPDSPIDVDCGLTSLYTVMRWKGIDVDLASLRNALPAYAPRRLHRSLRRCTRSN